MIMLVVLLGRRAIGRLGWGINPHSVFHKVLGLLLVAVGIALTIGADKDMLAWMVEQGWFDWQVAIESLLQE